MKMFQKPSRLEVGQKRTSNNWRKYARDLRLAIVNNAIWMNPELKFVAVAAHTRILTVDAVGVWDKD